jgi:hypothetical protein
VSATSPTTDGGSPEAEPLSDTELTIQRTMHATSRSLGDTSDEAVDRARWLATIDALRDDLATERAAREAAEAKLEAFVRDHEAMVCRMSLLAMGSGAGGTD